MIRCDDLCIGMSTLPFFQSEKNHALSIFYLTIYNGMKRKQFINQIYNIKANTKYYK